MPPAFAVRSQLLWRILRVVNQHVRAVGQLSQILIASVLAGFIVSRIHDRAAGRIDPVSQASLRMIQITRGNMRSVNLKRLRVGPFPENRGPRPPWPAPPQKEGGGG